MKSGQAFAQKWDIYRLVIITHDTGGERVEHVEGVALLRVDDGERVVRPRAQHRRLHHPHLAADHHLQFNSTRVCF